MSSVRYGMQECVIPGFWCSTGIHREVIPMCCVEGAETWCRLQYQAAECGGQMTASLAGL